MTFSKIIFTLLFTLLGSFVQANEQLGELKVTDFYLEPKYSTDDPSGKEGFFTGKNYLGIGWSQDKVISGRLMVGNRQMLVVPARYGADDTSYGLIEAYGQADTGYGLFQFGQIPILFGYDGGHPEYENEFQYDLLYQNRLFMRRDQGGSFSINHNGFYSYFAIHNGEAGDDHDRRLWFTGRFSWKGAANSEVGFSGSTGRQVDVITGREEKVRMGNVFGGLRIYNLGIAAESTMATVLYQGSFYKQIFSWHVDLLHPLVGAVGLQARYDFLDPNSQLSGVQKRELTAGLNIKSHYKTSTFYILDTTQWQDGVATPGTWVQVIWRLTPWFFDNQ